MVLFLPLCIDRCKIILSADVHPTSGRSKCSMCFSLLLEFSQLSTYWEVFIYTAGQILTIKIYGRLVSNIQYMSMTNYKAERVNLHVLYFFFIIFTKGTTFMICYCFSGGQSPAKRRSTLLRKNFLL